MADRVLVGGEWLHLSRHAIERWQERLRPGLTEEQVAAEMRRILAAAEISRVAPAWSHDAPVAAGEPADRWVIVSDDIALPVSSRGVILTTLDRASVSPHLREARNRTRRRRQRVGRTSARDRAQARRDRERYE